MEERKTIAVANVGDLWNQLLPDFSTGLGLHDYRAAIQLESKTIDLDISSSPGGNNEGGYESTIIRSALAAHPGLNFVIFPEDFLNRIGKLFGMQDVVLGYPEFDENVIVKTNNPEGLKNVFSKAEVRQVFQTLSGFSLKLDSNDDDQEHYLELNIQRAVKDLNELQRILTAFYDVLTTIH